MRHRVNVLILGAGATGLGAAYRLAQLNVPDWILVEAKSHAGGLASSFIDAQGFTWDIGGHVQFSHYDEYDQMVDSVLGDERQWHNRNALISLGTRTVPYPFQFNIHRLDVNEQKKAISGLEKASLNEKYADQRASNFLEWIFSTFGDGIAELFMIPYNMKVWGVPLELLDYAWTGDRVAVPTIEQIRRSLDSKLDHHDWGPNQQFWYPTFGGTGGIWSRLACRFSSEQIRFGLAVNRINLRGRTATLRDGTVVHWNTLITSLPLDVFCNLCEDVESEIRTASSQLIYNSCEFVGIGLKGMVPEELRSVSWIYFPSEFSPYYRITILSNYSPNNVPLGCWSLVCEVTHTSFRPLPSSDLPELVLNSLYRDGIVSQTNEIVSVWRYSVERGYPVPSLGRDKLLVKILSYLERYQVYSRGRFGAWKYEVSNQDHCFMQGFELVNRLFKGEEEATILHPDLVNRRKASARQQP